MSSMTTTRDQTTKHIDKNPYVLIKIDKDSFPFLPLLILHRHTHVQRIYNVMFI